MLAPGPHEQNLALVFPANHLAMVLTKQTHNNQYKYKKPKNIHKKPQKLNLTEPN